MGRNNADFLGVDYEYSLESHPRERRRVHTIRAYIENKEVGLFQWERLKDDGEVVGIDVDSGYRRKGIATGMWKYAKKLADQGKVDAEPWHSENTTLEGYRWAMSTGDPVPARTGFLMEEDEKPGPGDNNWEGTDSSVQYNYKNY